MNKQEFLAASLPYGLKCITNICSGQDKNLILPIMGINHIKDNYTIRFYTNGEYGDCFLEDVIPIIRPIDSLTKECVQADYNDGKPFIPMKELERLFPYCNYYLLDDNGSTVIGFDNRDYDNDVTIEDMITVTQQLLKWHFWPNMPEGEAVVWVTDEFNPYK